MSPEDQRRLWDKLDRIAEDGAATRADVKNLNAYIGAVRDNQKSSDAKLSAHLLDPEAHGAKAASNRVSGIIQVATFIIAAVAFILGLGRGTKASGQVIEARTK